MAMKTRIIGSLFLSLTFAAVAADESFRTLKVKGEIYTNVVVTSSTATDIYFSHSRGLASAKLKDLNPELQKHFHYDAATSSQIEAAQRQATTEYRANLAKAKPPTRTRTEAPATPAAPVAGDDFIAPALSARSIRGQPAPAIAIGKWLTDAPSTQGKFVLVDFWATWCGPCRRSIPELNAFQNKFKDRLTVVGISDESEADVRKMTVPHIEYAIAIDPQQSMMRNLQIRGIPHCLLIDPSGIVRFEGNPLYLDDQKVEHFLDKYSR